MNVLMDVIRKIFAAIFIFINHVFSPEPMNRSRKQQERIDLQTQNLKLYQFTACPFCIKVRRAIKRMALNIEVRDVKNNQKFRQELLTQGGRIQVPCLRIIAENGQKIWLYESSDIIKYLQKISI